MARVRCQHTVGTLHASQGILPTLSRSRHQGRSKPSRENNQQREAKTPNPIRSEYHLDRVLCVPIPCSPTLPLHPCKANLNPETRPPIGLRGVSGGGLTYELEEDDVGALARAPLHGVLEPLARRQVLPTPATDNNENKNSDAAIHPVNTPGGSPNCLYVRCCHLWSVRRRAGLATYPHSSAFAT